MKMNELSRKFTFLIIFIFFVMIIFVGIGFGVFAAYPGEVTYQEENGGNIVINYSADFAGLRIKEATPITDALALKIEDSDSFFDFSVDVLLDKAKEINYEIAAIKNTAFSTISDDDIRICLEQEDSGEYKTVSDPSSFIPLKTESKLGTKPGNMVLSTVKKTSSGSDHYRLRMWLSDKSLLSSGSYEIEIVVNGYTK